MLRTNPVSHLSTLTPAENAPPVQALKMGRHRKHFARGFRFPLTSLGMGSGQSPEPVEQKQRKKYRSVPGHLRTYLCFGCLTEGGDLSPALCATQVLAPQEKPQGTQLSLPLASFNHLGSMIPMDIYSYGRIRPKLLSRDTALCCPLSPTSRLLALSLLHPGSLALVSLSCPVIPSLLCCSSLPLPSQGGSVGWRRGTRGMEEGAVMGLGVWSRC